MANNFLSACIDTVRPSGFFLYSNLCSLLWTRNERNLQWWIQWILIKLSHRRFTLPFVILNKLAMTSFASQSSVLPVAPSRFPWQCGIVTHSTEGSALEASVLMPHNWGWCCHFKRPHCWWTPPLPLHLRLGRSSLWPVTKKWPAWLIQLWGNIHSTVEPSNRRLFLIKKMRNWTVFVRKVIPITQVLHCDHWGEFCKRFPSLLLLPPKLHTPTPPPVVVGFAVTTDGPERAFCNFHLVCVGILMFFDESEEISTFYSPHSFTAVAKAEDWNTVGCGLWRHILQPTRGGLDEGWHNIRESIQMTGAEWSSSFSSVRARLMMVVVPHRMGLGMGIQGIAYCSWGWLCQNMNNKTCVCDFFSSFSVELFLLLLLLLLLLFFLGTVVDNWVCRWHFLDFLLLWRWSIRWIFL